MYSESNSSSEGSFASTTWSFGGDPSAWSTTQFSVNVETDDSEWEDYDDEDESDISMVEAVNVPQPFEEHVRLISVDFSVYHNNTWLIISKLQKSKLWEETAQKVGGKRELVKLLLFNSYLAVASRMAHLANPSTSKVLALRVAPVIPAFANLANMYGEYHLAGELYEFADPESDAKRAYYLAMGALMGKFSSSIPLDWWYPVQDGDIATLNYVCFRLGYQFNEPYASVAYRYHNHVAFDFGGQEALESISNSCLAVARGITDYEALYRSLTWDDDGDEPSGFDLLGVCHTKPRLYPLDGSSGERKVLVDKAICSLGKVFKLTTKRSHAGRTGDPAQFHCRYGYLRDSLGTHLDVRTMLVPSVIFDIPYVHSTLDGPDIKQGFGELFSVTSFAESIEQVSRLARRKSLTRGQAPD